MQADPYRTDSFQFLLYSVRPILSGPPGRMKYLEFSIGKNNNNNHSTNLKTIFPDEDTIIQLLWVVLIFWKTRFKSKMSWQCYERLNHSFISFNNATITCTICVRCLVAQIHHTHCSPHSVPHTLLPPSSWNTSRAQEPSQMLTPPSSIHFKAPSKAEHWSNSISPTKPAILLFKTPVWGFYNCTLTWELWFWVKTWAALSFIRLLYVSAEESSLLNLHNLCSQYPSLPLYLLLCTAQGPTLKNTVFPFQKIKQNSHYGSPNACFPWRLHDSHLSMHRNTLDKTHAGGGQGLRETGAAVGQRTYFVVPLCMEPQGKKETKKKYVTYKFILKLWGFFMLEQNQNK